MAPTKADEIVGSNYYYRHMTGVRTTHFQRQTFIGQEKMAEFRTCTGIQSFRRNFFRNTNQISPYYFVVERRLQPLKHQSQRSCNKNVGQKTAERKCG